VELLNAKPRENYGFFFATAMTSPPTPGIIPRVASGWYDAFTSKAANSVPPCVSDSHLPSFPMWVEAMPRSVEPTTCRHCALDDHLIILGVDAADSAFDRLRGHVFARGSVGTLVMAISYGASSGCCRSVSANASRRGCFSALVKSALATAVESAQLIFP
jgi:hypothetical protein